MSTINITHKTPHQDIPSIKQKTNKPPSTNCLTLPKHEKLTNFPLLALTQALVLTTMLTSKTVQIRTEVDYKPKPDQQLQSQRRTTRTACQNTPRNPKDSPKGQTKAQQSFYSYSFERRLDNATVPVNKFLHSTLKTHTSLTMTKITSITTNNKLAANMLAATRARTAKKKL